MTLNNNHIKAFTKLFLYILWFGCYGTYAVAQTIRIAPHDAEQYLRIAFDFPNITGYNVIPNIDNNSFIINFETASSYGLPAITAGSRNYLKNIERVSPTQIRLTLQDEMSFNPFRFNNAIVFDISRGNFSEIAARYVPTNQSSATDTVGRLVPQTTTAPTQLNTGRVNVGDDIIGELVPQTTNNGDAITSDLLQRSRQDTAINFSGTDSSVAQVQRSNNRTNVEVIEINTYTLQGDGARLEFIFSAPPQYQAIVGQNNVTISFDRPFTADNLSEIEGTLPFALGPARISANGQNFIIPTTQRLALAHRLIGNKVVVDILPRDNISDFVAGEEAIIRDDTNINNNANIIAGYDNLPTAEEQALIIRAQIQSDNVFSSEAVDSEQIDLNDDGRTNAVRIGRTPEYLRLIFDFDDDIQYLIEHINQELQITFGQRNPIDISALQFSDDEPFSDPRVLQIDSTTVFALGVPNNYNIRHFRSGAKIIIDLLPKSQKLTQVDDLPDAVTQSDSERFSILPFTFPKTELNRRLDTSVENLPDALQTITIPLTEDVATAFFFYNGYYWFVVDRSLPVNLNKISQDLLPLLLEVTRIPNDAATILRFTPSRTLNASMSQKGFNYVLRFHNEEYFPPNSLSGHIQRDGKNNKFLLISAQNVGRAVIIDDPLHENDLLVGTFKNIGYGNILQRDFVEFSMLLTQQGIAVLPYSEGVEILETETGYIINKESGLNVLRQKIENEIAQTENPSGASILNFPPLSYSTESFLDTRTVLRTTFDPGSDDNLRGESYLSAATFYLGQRLGVEALAHVTLYENNPSFDETRLDYRLAKAAALLMLDRTDNAIEILADDAFSNYEESVLWQGLAAAQKGEWDQAKLRFDRSIDYIRRYPIYLRNWLSYAQIETAFATEDSVTAQTWLDLLRPFNNRMNIYELQKFLYYDGLLTLRKEDYLSAYQIWEDMKALKPNNKWVVLAELERQSNEFDAGRLSLEDSLETLEHLRYLWRGDELELRVLSNLGRLYLDIGSVELGLNILRNAAAVFPENPAALLLTQEMLSVFRSVFLDPNRSNIDAQTSLKLLRDFRELLPIGNERVQIISSIANNLIKEQFYGNANELLEPLIAERLLTTPQKRQLIVKVSLLHIINENPEGAINVLETYRSNIGIESSTESIDARRLYAKALIDLGQTESALDLIAGDLSLSANLLRRDIFWNNQDWHRAALTMQRLTGEPPAEDIFLENQRANYLIGWLLSLQLSQQDDVLRQVSTSFEPSMRNSPLREVFDYLRNTDTNNFSPDQVNEIIKIFSTQSVVETFITEYRNRYFEEIL